MNPYFSRLAQRSGLASSSASVKPGTSPANAPEWSEQSVETTAPANSLISNTANLATSTTIENNSLQASELGLPPVTMTSTNVSSKTISAQQPEQKTAPQNRSGKSSLIANTLSIGSDFIPHDSLRDSSNLATSVSVQTPTSSAERTESSLISANHASTIFDQPLAAKVSAAESTAEDTVHAEAISSAPAERVERSSIKARNTTSAPTYSELEIETTDKLDDRAPAVARTHVVQSKPIAAGAGQVEHVSSAPVQTPALPLQAPRAAARSSIEVHIGKIELEIFSPTRKPASAPAAAQVQAPRTSPAAAFNPHRHYLRSR